MSALIFTLSEYSGQMKTLPVFASIFLTDLSLFFKTIHTTNFTGDSGLSEA